MNRSSFSILLYLALLSFFSTQGRAMIANSPGSQQANTASIGNFVWHDKDADGVQDFNEHGIENIRILLFDSNDTFIGIEYTDANGFFSFENLSPGSYRVKFPTVQGLSFTHKDKGSDQNDSDANMNGYTDFFNVGQNQIQSTIDAGYKGSLQVYLGNSIQTCEGKEIELNASVFYGKGPYSFQWNNNLGSGSSKIVSPLSTTIYSVTATDGWGTTSSAMVIVRVKKGVGEEHCHTIDDFTSDGPDDIINIEVTPLDPGPKTITEISSLGLLGDSREITFEHKSGPQPANLMLDYASGLFTNSNDVGTVSESKLCYNNHDQGLDFDLDAFDYLKFSNIEVDQGGINLVVTISDGMKEVSVDRKLPGLGSATIFDNELPLEFIPGISNIDLTNIYEVCFTFYTSAPSVDLSLESIAACRTTDCELEMTPDQDICLGETVTIEALAPCADNVIYEWDNNLGKGLSHEVSPIQTTTYHVTVTDQAGCIAMGEVSITVNPTPNVSLGPDREVCEGESFTITAVGSGGTPPYFYNWSDDSTGDSDQKTGIATASSLISVTVTDAKGCQNTDQITLTVHENPSIRTKSTLVDCGIENGTATVTAEDGTPPYSFSWSNGENGEQIKDLAPGLYRVTATDVNGCFATAEELVKEKYCGMIGDYVWLDDNGNGLQDDSESGVNGVEVILYNELLSPLDTTFSHLDGYYAFNNLQPNNYHVQFILPQEYHFTSPNQGIDTLDSDADSMTGVTPLIQIDSMEQDRSIDAGIFQKASIGNFVWLDNNGNGLQDDEETGVANLAVDLEDCNGNTLSQAITDSDGYYVFSDLKPGNYLIHYQLPEGMAFTKENIGNDPEKDSDADPLNGKTSCELLSSDEENMGLDAGLYAPATIGDFVWHDLNANGIQDPDEEGIANVEMYLLDCTQQYLDTTWTNEQGYYSFEGLIPADYQIGILLPGDFELSPLNNGANDKDSDIDPLNKLSTCFSVLSGENINDKDAGLFKRASIGDFVWEDLNGNGLQEVNEPGLAQIEVSLYDCANNPISSTTTSANGYYEFNALLPGAYSVHFELPGAYSFTSLKEGDNAALDSDANPLNGFSSCEVLISGENNTSYDAGLFQPGEIGDLVWDDINVNGLQDPGEPGVENIKVILEDCNGTRLDSTVTSSNGEYLFGDVLPGIYQLNFGQNEDIYFSLENAGYDDEDSDVNRYSGITECFLLESNASDLSWDAGLAFTGDVGDWVWEDMNGNGIQDSGEPGISGIGVKLYKLENNMSILMSETYTDAAGYYIFEDVIPGNYFIEFMITDPYEVTFEDANQDFIDSDITHNNGFNTTDVFTVTPGIYKMDIDAGLYICAELGDLVWCDYTKNDHWDADENGINGLDVNLYRQGSNNNWLLWETTTTEWHSLSTCGDGYWSFCVIPGTYYFEIIIPDQANLIPVEPNQGSNEEFDSDITHAFGQNTSSAFTVLSQEVKTDMAGGYFYGAILGDTIWLDENMNGIQDEGESGIQNVHVELFDETGKIDETYSDYRGHYVFRHLLEGSFYLKFNAAPGMEFSNAFSGNDPKKDSNVTGANGPGTTDWIDLIIEEKNYTIDAGLHETQSGQAPPDEGTGYLYPNPGNGLMTLSFTPVLDEKVHIFINNSKGDFVKEYTGLYVEANKRSEFPMDMSQLPPGQYSIRVFGQSKIWEGKFTKVQ
jgi:protocatechuate 3,4-dioxygenase beta subunit